MEKATNRIEEKSNYEFLKNEIEKGILSTPEGKDRKDHLFETLCMDYGLDLSQKIIESLPSSFFNEKENTENETPTKTNREMNETKLEETLKKDFDLSDDKIKEIKNNPRVKKILKVGVFSALAIASLSGILKDTDFKENKKEDSLDEKKKDIIKNEKNLDKTISLDKRFDGEVYAMLPEGGKDIYKHMAEENPTPGRGYQMLDKDNAIIYVFNQSNELIGKITAGFGKDEGDELNTSEELNQGVQTTPAGVYLFSNYTTEKDLEEFGKLQFSLLGKSVLGDAVYLGQHQTYPEEIISRTKKLKTPNPQDNKFSNGCINISAEDFEKYIQTNFKGDYGEFMFILQDKKGRDSGIKFDTKKLIESVIPTIIEMANEEMNLYSKSIVETKESINEITNEITRLEAEQNKLVGEYKNDRNSSKQKKIAELKNEIKEKIKERGTLRELLGIYTEKIKRTTIKRDRVEKILVEMD